MTFRRRCLRRARTALGGAGFALVRTRSVRPTH